MRWRIANACPYQKARTCGFIEVLVAVEYRRSVMLIVVSMLVAVRSLVRSRAALHLEIVALRHQLLVLERSRRPRLRLTALDRLFWVCVSQIWTEWRPALVLVKPETVVAWHRRSFRLFWTWKSRRRTGRPIVPADVRALIRLSLPESLYVGIL